MKQVKIGDITEVLTGQSAPQDPNAFGESGIPFIRAGSLQSLQNGKREEDFELINQDFAKKYRLKLFPKDTVIFAKSGMSAKLGRIYRLKTPSYLVSHLAAILPSEDLNPGYLVRWLHKNPPSRLIPNDAYPSIKTSSIASMKIELPELGYQEHVAKILDKADALRQKRKESIKLLDDYLCSTFLEMFGDPKINQKGWEVIKTIEFCDCIVPGRDKPKSFTGNIPWVTTNDLIDLGRTSRSKKMIGLTNDEIAYVNARIIPKGSVIMTCVGDLGIISIADDEMVINQQLHAFQCKNDLNNIFLMYSLSFQKPYMYKMASKTTVPYMNKTVCNNTPTIKPPILLQNKFADIFYQVEKLKARYKESEKELDNLFGSLMQRAFKGEL